MKVKKLFFKFLIGCVSLLMLVACVPSEAVKSGTNKNGCGADQTFDPRTRTCRNLKLIPQPQSTSFAATEDVAKLLTLDYKTERGGANATSCSATVSSNSTSKISISTCSCASGVCTLTMTPKSLFVGLASFDYSITNSYGESDLKNAQVEVKSVAHAPHSLKISVNGLSPANYFTILEDTDTNATINYTDEDNDLAEYCQVAKNNSGTTYQNFLFVYDRISYTSCHCYLGTCGFLISPDSNYASATSEASKSVYVRVSAGGTWSAWQNVTFRVTNVDDAPVALNIYPTSSPFSLNEDEYNKTVILSYKDDDTDVTSTTVDFKIKNGTGLSFICPYDGVSDPKTTACPCDAGLCSVWISGALDYNGTTFFDYKVTVDGQATNWTSLYTNVIADNDSPTIDASAIPATPTAGFEDTVASYSIIVDEGGENSLASLDNENSQPITLYATSSNTTLFPAGSITFSSTNYSYLNTIGTFTITDSLNARLVNDLKVNLNPALNANGTATITIAVSDGSAVTTHAFPVIINAVDDSPVFYQNGTPVTSATLDSSQYNVNQGGWINITDLSVDEGGGDDEDSQTLLLMATPTGSILSKAVFTPAFDDDDKDSFNHSKINLWVKTKRDRNGTGYVYLVPQAAGTPTPLALKIVSNSVSAQHNGWSNIKSIGKKVDRFGNELESGFIEIDWKEFTVSSGTTINGWNIYRAVGTPDPSTGIITNYVKLNATPQSASTRSYIDTDADDGGSNDLDEDSSYYYMVRPVDGNGKEIFTAESVFPYLRVYYPGTNMVFVHQWMMNQEVCDKMGMGTESSQNSSSAYKCGDYDIGTDLLVDRYEAGCDFTTVSLGTPASADNHYNRTTGNCAYHGTPIMQVTPTAGNEYYAHASTLNPPLVNINQKMASLLCFYRPSSQGYDFKLPTRKQQLAVSSWEDSTYNLTTLSDVAISTYETGLSIGTGVTSKCNSSSASGVEQDYSDSNEPLLSFYHTISGSNSSNIRSLATGSDQTKLCQSRYGIQDFSGNVNEWTLDQFSCTASMTTDPNPCVSIDSTPGAGIPSSISSFYGLTGTAAPYPISSITWGDTNSSYVYFPLGYPVTVPDTSIEEMVQIGSTLTAANFHQDLLITATSSFAPVGIYGVVTGGSYTDGVGSGRYSFELIPASATSTYTGFRCYSDSLGAQGQYREDE